MVKRKVPPPPEQFLFALEPDEEALGLLNFYFECQDAIRKSAFERWNELIDKGHQPRPGSVHTWIWEWREGITPLARMLKQIPPIVIRGMAKGIGEEIRLGLREWHDRRLNLCWFPKEDDPEALDVQTGVQLDLEEGILSLQGLGNALRIPFDRKRSFFHGVSTRPRNGVILRNPNKQLDQFSALVEMKSEPITVSDAEGVLALDWGATDWLFWRLGDPIVFPNGIKRLHRKLISLQDRHIDSLKPSEDRREWKQQYLNLNEALNREYRSWYRVVARDLFQRTHTLVLEDFRSVMKRNPKGFQILPSSVQAMKDALERCRWDLMIEIFQWVADTNDRVLALVHPAKHSVLIHAA